MLLPFGSNPEQAAPLQQSPASPDSAAGGESSLTAGWGRSQYHTLNKPKQPGNNVLKITE